MSKVSVWEMRDELSILASRVGLVENSDAGRSAFKAWLGTDHQAARKALFSRVATQRVAASAKQAAVQPAAATATPAPAYRPLNAAEAQAAATGHATAYPASWRKSRAVGAAVVTAARAAGSVRTRITAAND